MPVYEEFVADIDKFLKEGVSKFKFSAPAAKTKGLGTFMTQAGSPKGTKRSGTIKSHKKTDENKKAAKSAWGKTADTLTTLLSADVQKLLKPCCPTFQLLHDYPNSVKRLVIRGAVITMKPTASALHDEMFRWD